MNLWTQYVEIIYAPEAQINAMRMLKENPSMNPGDDDEELGFASKMEEETIEERLKILLDKLKNLKIRIIRIIRA